MKRTLGHSPRREEDVFDITDYKIDSLEVLIVLISDYMSKKLPTKRRRRFWPSKINLLPNILEDLYDLQSMIGMNKLKNQIVDQILFFVQGIDENVMLHTVLEGPPGTGKTTVSHIMAKIYSKLGIFKKAKFNIVKRSDLISEYLGGTTIKTTETLNRCKNGVILIDEAYSLGSQPGTDDMYAKECVDALNEYLSENVDKIVCIIAGYQKQLNDSFFSLNPGLKRRFPWTFTIENYNSSELADIYFKQVKEKEWETSCKKEDLISITNRNIRLFDGNGGDINTIIEKAMIINTRKNFGRDTLYTLDIDDFKDAYDIFVENKKSKDISPPYGMYT
jgi:SpoVK/Ycf46/Vps4 family AAA+-type ATPase